METEAAYRLVLALTGVGLFLMVLEIWMANYAMGIIGAMAVLGAIGLAFVECSIDVASLVLLGSTTIITLGFLLMLVYLPKSPLAQQMFARAAERARREAEEAEEAKSRGDEEDDLDNEFWGEAAQEAKVEARRLKQLKEQHVHLPPLDLDVSDALEEAASKSEKLPGTACAADIPDAGIGHKQA